MLVMGVDIGSASTKLVVLDGEKNREEKSVLARISVPLGTGTSGPEKALKALWNVHGLRYGHMARICATGYGRASFQGAQLQVSEISCHARGVCFLEPEAQTIVDIGGQDVKAIRLGPGGRVSRFVMNDKCAAGTGRFLEVMARVLELELSELAVLDGQAQNPVSISSTCTVFAESEVISHLAAGRQKEDIVAGIHRSAAAKAAALAFRAGVGASVVMTGGAALNAGVVRALEQELNQSIRVAEQPQTVGALGAALYAYDDWVKDKAKG